MQKLQEQLRGTTAEATKLTAEMIWVLMLFPTNYSFEKKVQKVREVWEFSGDALPDSEMLSAPVLAGIGSAGQGFINHQPFELGFLIRVVKDLKELTQQELTLLLDDPWQLVSKLDAYEGVGQRQLRHIIPHLLHPTLFERIASSGHKSQILEKFGFEDAARATELEQTDRGLLELRRRLELEYPDRKDLDYYRPPLIERWQLDDLPEIELAREGLERLRELFCSKFEDFESFVQPGEAIEAEELGYKHVLRKRFADVVGELRPSEDLSEEDAVRIVQELKSLLTRKLDPFPFSQNLISWRYTRFLSDLEPSEAMVVVRALIDLVEPDTVSPAKIHRFNDDVLPVLEAHDSASYAVSRSLPTLFLWLHDPENEIYVRTDLFDGVAKELTGERLFRNKRMDMEQYQRALALAHGIRAALEGWGWGPRDMIDVQTFMWTAYESLNNGNGKTPSAHRGLQEIVDLLEADGFHFPPDLVANYILALQAKRLVILTGISGTGKTRLAMKVAEFFIGAETADGADLRDRMLVIAVRPDWTDPRGLIGYYNPISGQYMRTDFLNLVLAAREEEAAAEREARAPRPFFVILDEMNLARVEHYFSDFLSALESGKRLSLHQQTDSDETSNAVPSHLRIPRNVFFTGTVNVDETTHMFSPKVLDRAFTLELNEVDLDGWALGETDRPGSTPRLPLPLMEPELRLRRQPGAEDWRGFGALLEGKLRETVTALNAALAPTGYHFGYRVAGEIAAFVLLAEAQGAKTEEALWRALDLALLEKVLPKFHGTEQELDAPLRTVAFVARHGRAPTDAESDAVLSGSGSISDEAPRLARCAEKVDRMLRRLQQRGFAAFIE